MRRNNEGLFYYTESLAGVSHTWLRDTRSQQQSDVVQSGNEKWKFVI